MQCNAVQTQCKCNAMKCNEIQSKCNGTQVQCKCNAMKYNQNAMERKCNVNARHWNAIQTQYKC